VVLIRSPQLADAGGNAARRPALWSSTERLGGGQPTLRSCAYRTSWLIRPPLSRSGGPVRWSACAPGRYDFLVNASNGVTVTVNGVCPRLNIYEVRYTAVPVESPPGQAAPATWYGLVRVMQAIRTADLVVRSPRSSDTCMYLRLLTMPTLRPATALRRGG
jgi:hypothetical protein